MDAAFKKAKDHIGQMFDKNMHDLVRGIRNHKENESKFIAECMDEIKQELKLDNITIKTNAIAKLCYVPYFFFFDKQTFVPFVLAWVSQNPSRTQAEMSVYKS
jgi:hypothetical protein